MRKEAKRQTKKWWNSSPGWSGYYRVYIELSRRRQEAQKSGEQPDEVICPRHDLSEYLPEKHETRTKIYDYLIKKDYIKLDDSTHELYCFVLTDSTKEYARVELFPEFEGKYERRQQLIGTCLRPKPYHKS